MTQPPDPNISAASLEQAEKLIPKGTPNRKGVIRKVALALDEAHRESFRSGLEEARYDRVPKHRGMK